MSEIDNFNAGGILTTDTLYNIFKPKYKKICKTPLNGVTFDVITFKNEEIPNLIKFYKKHAPQLFKYHANFFLTNRIYEELVIRKAPVVRALYKGKIVGYLLLLLPPIGRLFEKYQILFPVVYSKHKNKKINQFMHLFALLYAKTTLKQSDLAVIIYKSMSLRFPSIKTSIKERMKEQTLLLKEKYDLDREKLLYNFYEKKFGLKPQYVEKRLKNRGGYTCYIFKL